MRVGSVVAVRPPQPDRALVWLARVDQLATTRGCNITWLEGGLRTRYHVGEKAYISSASLMAEVRPAIGTASVLLTRAERQRLQRLMRLDQYQTMTQWLYPNGDMLQTHLDMLHTAMRRAHYDRRLARNAVRLGPSQWCTDARSPGSVWSILNASLHMCTIMRWDCWNDGLRPSTHIIDAQVDKLKRAMVIDRRTGDHASAAAAHGPSLQVMSNGDCRIRLTRGLAAYTVAAGRNMGRDRRQVLIAPMATMAAQVGLTPAEAKAGIHQANHAHWPPGIQRFWWTQATAAYTRASWGDRVRLCPCCQRNGIVAIDSPLHVAADCPDWNAGWGWARRTLARAKMPIAPGTTRAQWMLFGHGSTVAARQTVFTCVWGAVLQAVNGLRYGVVADGTDFTPTAVRAVAKNTVVRAAAADFERVRGSAHALTAQQWAARWNGLLRPNRRSVTGFDVLSDW